MFGLALRLPHWRATSSGSSNLNSPWLPSHAIQAALDWGSASNSSRNYTKVMNKGTFFTLSLLKFYFNLKKNNKSTCHNWICPDVEAGSGSCTDLPPSLLMSGESGEPFFLRAIPRVVCRKSWIHQDGCVADADGDADMAVADGDSLAVECVKDMLFDWQVNSWVDCGWTRIVSSTSAPSPAG